ncbi:MAG: hypothetical protein Q7T74_05450, partial [Candidatus Saccharibacteria bacterium]|nr:hypothetical protein [Candidatus Saccharibacteria bacterium]
MLDVYSSANAYTRSDAGTFSIRSQNATTPVFTLTGTSTADLVNIMDNSTEVFTILDGGNVGINNSGASYRLDIADATANGRGINVSQTATTGNVYGIYASATGAATNNYAIYANASGASNNYAAYLDGYTAVTGWLAANGGYLTTTSSTFNLVNDTATTVNFAGAGTTINLGPTGSGASTISLSGGSGDTGCTLNGANGSLTCSGDITGGSTGNSGYWNRTGTILSPLNAIDLISLSTVPQGSSGLSITTANISGGTTNGELITLGTTATGTHNGLNISAGSASSGTLNGINIGTVSGAGTKNALNIGTGWNNLLYSTVFVVNGSGKISVLAGQGLDTLSTGTLGVGVTTANQINIGTTGNAPITTGTGLLTAGGNLQVNGKVGIGTTTPTQPLTITSSSSPAIELHDTNSATSAGPKNPASATNYSFGTSSWTSTGNVFASDNTYASVTSSDLEESDLLEATNYSFSVPTDAIIKGVKVEFERSDGTGGYATNWVQLFKNGVPVGSAKGRGSDWSGIDTYESAGTSSDLWGTTWTPSEINNSTFGVGVGTLCFSGYGSCGVGSSGKIDHIRITVYYSVTWTIGADSSDSGKFKISGSSSLGTNNIISIDPNTSKISTSYTPVTGDLNRDGFVDFKDLGFLSTTGIWNCNSTQACWTTVYWVDNNGNPLRAKDGDLNGDGFVNGSDLSIMAGNYAPWGNMISGLSNTTMVIPTNVDIGYGTTNQLNLDVDNGSLCVDNDNTGCPVSPTAGRIYSISATVLTDDLAENMQSEENLEDGDVVSVRSNQPGNGDTFVERSTNPYDSKIAGVVSTNPGIVLGGLKEQENDYPIALSGRV